MSRFTRSIRNKQSYCGYEIKDCKYQQLYDFKRYDDIENYVDCDLTLAIDKFGELEDLEEEIGCPLEVREKALTNGIYIENIYGEMVNFKVMLVYKNKELGYYFRFINDGYVLLKDYKKTWWLRADRSE